MDNNDEHIIEIVSEYLKNGAFTDRKLTDTPTDNLQVVNKKYVDNQITSVTALIPSSIFGRMYLNSAQSIGVSSPTFGKVLLDTSNFSSGVTNDTANSKITILSAGTYQVNGAIEYIIPTAGQICAVSIYVNGAQVNRVWSNASLTNGNTSAMVSDIISASANDYVELYTTKTWADGTLNNSSLSTYLSLFRI